MSEPILDACGSGTAEEGERAIVAADAYLVEGNLEMAASALDRAYGLLPRDEAIARQRRAVLDELAVTEHGLVFRYIPAGTFLMGSFDGDPDERPVHPRRLDAYWMAEVPITWAAYCRLMGWSPPPGGHPPKDHPWLRGNADEPNPLFMLNQLRKIRLQYCETLATKATNWHLHANEPRRSSFDEKPMIAASPQDAEDLAAVLARPTEGIEFGLPTEAEWEKAARGGLIGCKWSWGNDPPTKELCDFDRFGAFHLENPRDRPANGYGLHGMCGGVAEWTGDRYDALAYANAVSGANPPAAVPPPEEDVRVLRGGSWADCAAAVTVSFRVAQAQSSWRSRPRGRWGAPTIGFRLIRRRTSAP